MAGKTSFFKKVIGRLEQLDPQGLRVVLERLASERSFLETLFNSIEDGVLVVDAKGRIIYCNHSAARLMG